MLTDSITFGGVNTLDDLGLRLIEVPELEPPGVKSVVVNIPGGDGSIDLSEFSGDVRYEQREMSFRFIMAANDRDGIEREKTAIARALHGQRAGFQLSWEPGFTYTGRAEITEYPDEYKRGFVELHIAADPYKFGGTETWYINAAGGVAVVIPCGRRRWCPTFQTQRETLVSYNGKSWTLPPGTSKITELFLEPGNNILIINSDPGYSVKVMDDYAALTMADLQEQYTRLYRVAAGDVPRQTPLVLSDIATDTWADYATKRIIELTNDADEDPTYGVYIQTQIYEI